MGKSKSAGKAKTANSIAKPNHSAHLSSKISTPSSSILLSSFSPSNLQLSLFASVVLGIDAQRLRIHDTTTGRLRAEHVLDKGAVVNSLSWSILSPSDGDKDKKKKKRKRASDGGDKEKEGTPVVALGMKKGTVLLYSPAESVVVGTLEGGHVGEVTAFEFEEVGKMRGWSCGTDGKIVEWDLTQKTPLRSIPLPDPAIRTITLSRPNVLCASHSVYAVNPDAPAVAPPKFAASASPIHSLLANAAKFLTVGESDRYINVFELSKSEPLGSLVAESDVKAVSINNASLVVLAAITTDGAVEIFSNPWQPTPPGSAPSNSRKAKAPKTRKAESKIRVTRPNGSETVSIVNAAFQGEGDVVVAWAEGGVNIEFERVKYLNTEENTLAISGVTDIVKAKLAGIGGNATGGAVQMNGAKDMGKTYVDQSHTVVVSGTDTQDMADIAVDENAASGSEASDEDVDSDDEEATKKLAAPEPTLAEKLAALQVKAGTVDATSAGDKKSTSAPTVAATKSLKPFSGSLTTVLTQALRTDDAQLLESCLLTADSKAILSTVRRLDSTYAVTLIEKLAERIARRPGRAATLGIWVRWTIVAHGGYLVSLPDLMRTLAGLHATLATRAGALPKLLQLQGRLDMLSAQLELRNSLRRGVGETGVGIDEEEEQREEGVLYIEGRDGSVDGSDADESDEEPEEVGMEGLVIEDASFIGGRGDVDASATDDDEDDEEDDGEEDEDEEDEEDEEVNGVAEEEDDDEEEDEEVERYGGLIDDEAEETDDDEEDEDEDEAEGYEVEVVGDSEEEEDDDDDESEVEPAPVKKGRAAAAAGKRR